MNTVSTPPEVPQARTNGLALTSFILGILSVVLCGVGVLFAIPGLICGIMGISRVKKSGGMEKGHGLALAGTILSGVSIAMLPVIGLLAAIAIPNFVKARNASQRAACVSNLRTIDAAKATWALENKKASSETPDATQLYGPGKYIKKELTCPAGGIYSINPVEEKPTCNVPGHAFY
jgi:competence protein ComGC